MIQIKVGPFTTNAEVPLVEAALVTIEETAVDVVALRMDVKALVAAVVGVPRIRFTVGPVSEQKE